MADHITTPVVFTKAGRRLLAKVLAGETLTFTKVVAGDGYLPEGTNVYEMTEMISPKKELPILSVVPNGEQEGQAVITSEVSNFGVMEPFYLREAGIFALDPDEGEILYSYKNEGDECSYLPVAKGPDLVWWTWSFAVVIDQAENVTAIFDSNAVFVTQEELIARIDSLFAAGVTPFSHVWTRIAGDDKKLRPIPVEEFKLAILGGNDFDSINRRLEVVETNQGETKLAIATLYDYLEIMDDYPEYENLMAENFNPPDTVDTYTCDVLSAVAGDDSLDCNPVAGMYPGSEYTISDGVRSERVQVKSVSLENGIQRVILYSPIVNRYNLADCHLYRSTASIDNGAAIGPREPGSAVWIPSTGTWQGQAADEEIYQTLETAVGNAEAFDITGEVSFTADNLVTLEAR